jgi:hypothetical protein
MKHPHDNGSSATIVIARIVLMSGIVFDSVKAPPDKERILFQATFSQATDPRDDFDYRSR